MQLSYPAEGLHQNQFFLYSFLQEIAWGHCQLVRNPCSAFVGHLDDTWRILKVFGDFLVKTSGLLTFMHRYLKSRGITASHSINVIMVSYHQITNSESTNWVSEYLLWFLFQLANWEKKLFWTNKVCFLFQLLKLRKILGKNWGKQEWLFGGLMSLTRC